MITLVLFPQQRPPACYYSYMNLIASATTVAHAKPSIIFQLWSEVEKWPTWDTSVQYAHLDGPFAVDTTGTLKPSHGPKTKITLVAVTQDKSFTNISQLPGAQLRFVHTLQPKNAQTEITHTVKISGPLSWLWSPLLTKSFQKDLATAVNGLKEHAERQ